MAFSPMNVGGSEDFVLPDAQYMGSVAANSDTTVSVTQKPKKIIAIFANAGNGNTFGCIYDCETDNSIRFQNTASQYIQFENPSAIVTSVTSASVTLHSISSTTNVLTAMIWY